MTETMDIKSPPTETAATAGHRGASRSFSFSQSMVMLSRPAEATAESLRALRTHIVAQHVDKGRRSLALSGVSPGVGCTFIASNLAVALSQIGLKTLLVDANLRAPGSTS